LRGQVAQDTRNRSEGFVLEEHQWQQVINF